MTTLPFGTEAIKPAHDAFCMCMDCCGKNAVAVMQTPEDRRAYELKREGREIEIKLAVRRAKLEKLTAQMHVRAARLQARIAKWRDIDAKRARVG